MHSSLLRGQRGITIIETTVILSVLFILAGVMSPVVNESITTARAVKAKSDAQMIAIGLVNFQKDLGADALSLTGLAVAAQRVGFPDILVTAGNVPSIEDAADDPATLPEVTLLAQANRGGRGARSSSAQRRGWLTGRAELLDDHLMYNRKGYRYRQPGEYGGWNGPYLTAELPGDPWGNKYLINTEFLDGGSTAADGSGRARRAVFVLSAGGDGIVQTPFDQSIVDAHAYGDDIVVRIQ